MRTHTIGAMTMSAIRTREPNQLDGVAHLTARQESVLVFLREFTASHHYPPTIRQIGEYFGFTSPNGVMYHLNALERKGRIVRDPKIARGIRLLNA